MLLRITFALGLLALPGAINRPPTALGGEPKRLVLKEAPAPPDNPLKGLVPYAGARRNSFPHSLEFNYLPMGALVDGPNDFNWAPMETLLDDIAGRGHQAVIRIYMEYPKKTDGIPQYLIDDGLTVHRWENTNTAPLPPAPVETPDYEDPRLRQLLQTFIAAFGERFDGDPRLGYITAGLLGTWGEWHTYPRSELFASKAVQREVMDSYESAFSKTPVLLRYPAGPDDSRYAPTQNRPGLGYHDDSFAWATLETGRNEDSWFFMALLRNAGPEAINKWKTAPIGGEIRPELWGKIFDENPGIAEAQDFDRCVQETHASWLMDTGMFSRRPSPPERVSRAIEAARSLGYTFHVRAVTLADTEGENQGDALPVQIEVANLGVAPFYADWPLEFALLDADKNIARRFTTEITLQGLLPEDPDRIIDYPIDLDGLSSGSYRLLLRVVNPLPNGIPLRFANAEQDQDLDGWLTLAPIEIPAP